MLGPIGQVLVLLSLLFAAMGAAVSFRAAVTKSNRLWNSGANLALAFAGSIIAANVVMVVALYQRDFSISYVAEVGSWATPAYYVLPSLWSSLNGSILLWGGVMGLYTGGLVVLHRNSHREYMPYTVGMMLVISVFFTWLVAGVADPFAPTLGEIPIDGPGPNPLLQNHYLMAFHPPSLYLGYVGMAVPFSMVCAALFAGRMEAGWIAPIRRWALIPWTFLTVGIAMGGWWSYEVLGWGGYWAWDPVENASFHPWLTATAFLHSAMLVERRGLARNWSIVLMMSTFLLTLIGTFMTRSGVFNSVHSFTQSDIGPIFLGFIAVVAIFCLNLVAFRIHRLEGDDGRDHTGRKEIKRDAVTGPNPLVEVMAWLMGAQGRVHALSREMAIILQNLLFTAFTFVVLLGTLYPLITEAWDPDWRVSVGEPYFDSMTLPIGILLVFLMGVGPSLPWGRAKDVNRIITPLGAGAAMAGALFALGFTLPGTIAAGFVCGYALYCNLREFWEPTWQRMRAKRETLPTAAVTVFSRAHRRFGGHIAHLGVVMAVLAMAVSKGYKWQKDYVFEPGQTHAFEQYEITFTGARTVEEPQRDSLITSFVVSHNGKELTVQEPRLNTYMVNVRGRDGKPQRVSRMREPIGTPAVYSTVRGDLYFSLMQVAEDGSWTSVRVMTMPGVPWLWVSIGVMAFGSGICLIPPRRRRDHAAKDDKPKIEAKV